MNAAPNVPRQIYSIASSNQADTFEQDLRQISPVLTTEGQYEKVMSAAAATSKFWKWKITPEKLEAQSYQTSTEPHSPFQNRAEGVIKSFKRKILAIIKRKKVPERFWDYVAMYVADIHNLTSSPLLDDRSPKEVFTWNISDISEYTDFGFYEPCMFYDSAEPFPKEKESLGRWMGISHRVGQGVCYWILKKNGEVVARSTVRPLTLEENTSDLLCLDEDDDDSTLSSYEEPDALMPEEDYDDYDKYLSAEVILLSKGN